MHRTTSTCSRHCCGAVVTAATPDAVALVSIDPTYPAAIQLPAAIIALEPGHGIPLPAGEVGILAGQGGERKSTLTIQMAIAAAAAEDGALVSPFTGRAVDPDDPFQVGGGLAVRGGPVCMATWEDAAPWLAVRARACAEHLDRQSGSERHTRVLTDAARVASVQLGNGSPLFGVTAADDRYALPHPIAAGWDRLWDTVKAVSAIFVTIDPINLAAVWTGYGPTEVGAFLGAIKDELDGRAGALLVGHTGKAAAKADEPSALDILGSGAWSHRARGCFVARAVDSHYELSLWSRRTTPPGPSGPTRPRQPGRSSPSMCRLRSGPSTTRTTRRCSRTCQPIRSRKLRSRDSLMAGRKTIHTRNRHWHRSSAFWRPGV